MDGEHGIVLDNVLWSLSKFIEQSQSLGLKYPNWNINLSDDSSLTVFGDSLVLTNNDYVALGAFLTVVVAKA